MFYSVLFTISVSSCHPSLGLCSNLYQPWCNWFLLLSVNLPSLHMETDLSIYDPVPWILTLAVLVPNQRKLSEVRRVNFTFVIATSHPVSKCTKLCYLITKNHKNPNVNIIISKCWCFFSPTSTLFIPSSPPSLIKVCWSPILLTTVYFLKIQILISTHYY